MSEESSLPLIKGPVEILKENGMWPVPYEFSKGKNVDDPIVITGIHDYVRMEYRILKHLYRFRNHDVLIQGLIEKDVSHIDCLLLKVSEEDGSNEHTEKVYFDITEGFNAL